MMQDNFSMRSRRLEQAVADWNKVAKTKLPSAEAFQKMLSVSPRLRKWYNDWSFQYSAFSEMPASFAKAGVTPEQWKEIQSKLPSINQVRKAVSDEIAQKAKEFSDFIDMKNREADEKVAKLEDPYVKILKVNVLCLPFETQLEIMSKPEEERDDFEKQKLEELRSKLLSDLKDKKFKDPFLYGDYKELLL